MADMSIAHYGTTLIEEPAPEGADQAAIPMTGDLARTHDFLTILGAEIYIRNMYPGMGRQFIYRRGEFEDADYFEKDTFTSYSAVPVPEAGKPRVSDVIFRLTHRDAAAIASKLLEQKLIEARSSVDDFLSGHADGFLFVGPDNQQYELCHSADNRADNHRIYIWTAEGDLAAHKAGYCDLFGFKEAGTEDFYDSGTAHLLRRDEPGMTIVLLVPLAGELAPKHSFDIFQDAGYSHFRLGAPDKKAVLNASMEAFPDGGGPVAYVHFQNAYLELVQIGQPI